LAKIHNLRRDFGAANTRNRNAQRISERVRNGPSDRATRAQAMTKSTRSQSGVSLSSARRLHDTTPFVVVALKKSGRIGNRTIIIASLPSPRRPVASGFPSLATLRIAPVFASTSTSVMSRVPGIEMSKDQTSLPRSFSISALLIVPCGACFSAILCASFLFTFA